MYFEVLVHSLTDINNQYKTTALQPYYGRVNLVRLQCT
eukprot:SAG31_NODE_32052_length_360_cov_1.436782_1_plen_37_part_01